MNLIASPLEPGRVGFDTFDVVTRPQLAPLADWKARFSFAARYLDNLTRGELEALCSSVGPVLPVTFADHFSPDEAIARATALGIPKGCHLWLDVEGLAASTNIPTLIAEINAWANKIKLAGWLPGAYFADRTLLTSAEMYALAIVGYWRGAARIMDRFGALAEPSCGWMLEQLTPANHPFGGTLIDFDVSRTDFHGRSVIACAAA
jgi:hypothetical protein